MAAAALALTAPQCLAAGMNSLTPSVTLETRYDSNARFRDERLTGDNSDLILSANPRLEYARDAARYDIHGFYSLIADYHTDNTELNNVSQSAGIGLEADLTSRWRFGAGDRVTYSEDSLRSIGFGEAVLVSRTDILTNDAYLELGRQTTKNTELTLTLRDYMQKYDDPAFFDSRTDSATLAGKYSYSQNGALRARYAFTNFHFDANGGTDIETHEVAAGVEQALSRSVKVNLGAGAEYASGLRGDDEVFITAEAGVEKTLKDSVMTLAYDRDITNPTGLTDEINIRDSVTFIWDFTVRKDLLASFYAGVAKHRTEPSGSVDINSYITEVSGNWQPYRWLLLGAGLSHYQQWPGDNLGTGLTRNRIFVNLTLTGGEWRF